MLSVSFTLRGAQLLGQLTNSFSLRVKLSHFLQLRKGLQFKYVPPDVIFVWALLFPCPPWCGVFYTGETETQPHCSSQGSSVCPSHVTVRNDDSFSCFFSASHQSPAACPVARTLCCLEEHFTSVGFPLMMSSCWGGRGLPYRDLWTVSGDFFPFWDLIPSCIFTTRCSRTAWLNEIMLDWKSQGHTNGHRGPKVPVEPCPTYSPCGAPQEPRAGSCCYLPRAFSALCLPGLEVVTSYIIAIPSRLLLDHLQFLHECKTRFSYLYSRACTWPSQECVNMSPSWDPKQLV